MLAGLRFDSGFSGSKKNKDKKKKRSKSPDQKSTERPQEDPNEPLRDAAEATKAPERRSLSPCRLLSGGRSPERGGHRGTSGERSETQRGDHSDAGDNGEAPVYLEQSSHHGLSSVAASRELNPLLRPARASSSENPAETTQSGALSVSPSAHTWRSAQTWRACQLRRLQERAQERGDTTVAQLVAEHLGADAALFPVGGPQPERRLSHRTSRSPLGRSEWRRDRGSYGEARGDRGESRARGRDERDDSGPSGRPWTRERSEERDGRERGDGRCQPRLDNGRSDRYLRPDPASGPVLSPLQEEDGARKPSWREKVATLASRRGAVESGPGHRAPRPARGWQRAESRREGREWDFVFSRSPPESHMGEAKPTTSSRMSDERPPGRSSLAGERGGSSCAAGQQKDDTERKFSFSDRHGGRASGAGDETPPQTNSSGPPPPSSSGPSSASSTPSASADINRLAADALRAQMCGDQRAFRRLGGLVAQRQLAATADELVRDDDANEGRFAFGASSILPRPAGGGAMRDEAAARRPRGDALDDGSSTQSVLDLQRRERGSDNASFDRACVNAVLSNRMGDDEDDPVAPKMSEKRRRITEERERNRGRLLNKQQGNCARCMDTQHFGRVHRAGIIAMSSQALLCFQPWRNCVLRSHLLLLPLAHVSSVTTVDDAGYEELRNFQKSIVTYFQETRGELPVFIETVTHFVAKEKLWMGAGPHTAVEVLPIPQDRLLEAKTYFRKAFEEAEGEWQQHKKVLEVRGREGIRSAIPANIPYIHVDFALTGGLAHVIEDGRSFSASFGRDVILGMLEKPPTDRAFFTEE
ncbi:cwfj family protein [Besnoitia besnoiti]|uniref:Cwfj family protein n=1 Tax=Besnoitia besnoiti TaxID=94643 RepID=A0A2A9MB98_BESBE|nr:cwfj family protein [Besnoitia besnoiti]PFH35768.1 cwfj family protein [Besnoitia besnoiti]